jgi:hypothetical protein
VDAELKLLLQGVRVVLVALVLLVVVAIALVPRLLHHPQPFGDGQCTVTDTVGVCITP